MSFISIVLVTGIFGWGAPGTSVMPVLRIEQGPRFAAMGGAGIGAVDDASAIYWNPGGLGRVRDKRYALSHHQWFGDVKDETLQAFVVLEPGVRLTAKTIQLECLSRLESFMVPRDIVFVAELPKTTSGKTDKLALA